MQISLDPGTATFRISGYGAGFVVVNEVRVERSILVRPEALSDSWAPQTIGELTPAHVLEIARLSPEIFILGTGARQHFPASEVLAPIVEKNIGYEIMDTSAACRTYNVLMAEGRDVLAALMMILP